MNGFRFIIWTSVSTLMLWLLTLAIIIIIIIIIAIIIISDVRPGILPVVIQAKSRRIKNGYCAERISDMRKGRK